MTKKITDDLIRDCLNKHLVGEWMEYEDDTMMRAGIQPVITTGMDNTEILCMICNDGITEATEQLPNESGLYVCYGCKIAQREVTP